MFKLNGIKKVALVALAGIVVGAVGALVASNPKAQKTIRDGGSRAVERVKNLRKQDDE